jgi:hypothetical protein
MRQDRQSDQIDAFDDGMISSTPPLTSSISVGQGAKAGAKPPRGGVTDNAAKDLPMAIWDELRAAKAEFKLLSIYQRFEHVVILVLTALIAVVVVAAVWNLSLKILFGVLFSGGLDPSDYSAFQAVFGMIFTVIIALEFKKSLLVVAQRGIASYRYGLWWLSRFSPSVGRLLSSI